MIREGGGWRRVTQPSEPVGPDGSPLSEDREKVQGSGSLGLCLPLSHVTFHESFCGCQSHFLSLSKMGIKQHLLPWFENRTRDHKVLKQWSDSKMREETVADIFLSVPHPEEYASFGYLGSAGGTAGSAKMQPPAGGGAFLHFLQEAWMLALGPVSVRPSEVTDASPNL